MEWLIIWTPVIVGGIVFIYFAGKMVGLYLNKNQKRNRRVFLVYLFSLLAVAMITAIYTVSVLTEKDKKEDQPAKISVCEQFFRVGDIQVQLMRNSVLLENDGPERMGRTYYQFETREMTNGMYGDAKVWKHNTVFAGLNPGEYYHYLQGARMAEDIEFVRIRPEGGSKWYEIDVSKCEMKSFAVQPGKPPW